ncbi:LYR family of Fe/S cluster biogenesis protein [Tanacetum coccineum]
MMSCYKISRRHAIFIRIKMDYLRAGYKSTTKWHKVQTSLVAYIWGGQGRVGNGELMQTIRQEMENNRDCNDRQRIRYLICEGMERLKNLDETLDMQGH